MDGDLLSLFHAVYQDLILLHDAYDAFQSIPAQGGKSIEDFVQGISFVVEVEAMYHLTASYHENGKKRNRNFNALEFIWEVFPGSCFFEFLADELSQVGSLSIYFLPSYAPLCQMHHFISLAVSILFGV